MAAANSFSMTRRRLPLWVKVVGVVVAASLIVVLVWALLVALAYGSTWLRLGPNVSPPSSVVAVGTQEPRAPEDAHTVLVVITGRDGTLEAPPALLQYGQARSRPVVVAIPRELTVVAGEEDRLDIADVYANGGLPALQQTLVDFTEVAVDDVITVSPRVIADVIDVVGTLTYCEPTCMPLDGTSFLTAFGLHDDYDRLEYVGAVLLSLADTVDRNWLIRHPRRAWQLVAALPQGVQTTVSLRGGVLVRALAGFRESPAPLWASTPLLRTSDGTVLAAPEPSMLQFVALRDGTPLPDGAQVSVDELRQELRDEVRVAVANAAGIQGLAAQFAERLERLGYQIVASGNAGRFDAQQTELQFRSDDPRAVYIAEEIAEQLGQVVLRPQEDTVFFEREAVDVLVLLGARSAS